MGTSPPAPDPKLDLYLAACAAAFPVAKAQVTEALALIRRHIKSTQNAQALQALALRRYLRMGGGKVQTQWAWSAEQARHLSGQGAFKRLVDEAAKVKTRFAAANPGFSLATSPLRSLERQIRLWNGNTSVQRAANGLQAKLIELLKDKQTFPDAPNGRGVAYPDEHTKKRPGEP